MGVSVRHNSRLAAVVALAAAVMTVAWFSRALQTGSIWDWAWCAGVAAIGVLQLLVVRDARAPLMVADEHGVRVRHGETWNGLRWQDIEHVEVRSPSSWLRDGQIVVRAADSDSDFGPGYEADGSFAQASGAYVVPLARTTRVEHDGMTGDLVDDLDALASGRVPVLALTGAGSVGAEFDGSDDGTGAVHAAQARQVTVEAEKTDVRVETAERVEQVEPVEQDEDVEQVGPGRPIRPVARSEVHLESVRRLPDASVVPSQRSTQGRLAVAYVDDPAAPAASSSAPVLDTPSDPAFDPASSAASSPGSSPAPQALIGPIIAAARHRARLSIDVLSERTRIRPHVLECIEVDDFEPCGGDFYARGHLRTLARVFGLDAQHLLDLYDEHYAHAEIEARQVFEAELATGIGGGVRAAHTGPRWSLLAACVLVLAGVWGVARVFDDTPPELVSPAPSVVESASLTKTDPAKAPQVTLAPLAVTAVDASPQVVVRDRDGRILWAGKLADGQRQQVIGLAPFDVTASNGAAVKVSYLNRPKGTVGDSPVAGNRQFG